MIQMFEQIKALRSKTGAGLRDCKKAVEYEKTHDGCTALGYLKAKALAVATPNSTWEERGRLFSKDGVN